MFDQIINRFSDVPKNEIQRSGFEWLFTHKTTFNMADLVPIYITDILPGDSLQLEVSSVFRTTTALKPVMDYCYVDLFFFFVPLRQVWDHTKEFFGENTQGAWAQTIEYIEPKLIINKGSIVDKTTILNHMGIGRNCAKEGNQEILRTPINAYCLIYNEWFRDQNLIAPLQIDKSDDNLVFDPNDPLKGGKMLKAAKEHDYFTSALPQPQKGEAVNMPLGQTAPVTITPSGMPTYVVQGEIKPLQLFGQITQFGNAKPVGLDTAYAGLSNIAVADPGFKAEVDLALATAASVESLRQAFAVQRILEKEARGGSRYREIIKSQFNVDIADTTIQIPEFLGAKRIPINKEQVVQTSATQSDSILGETGALSLTDDLSDLFTKSFDEWGFVIGLAVARQAHTYQQGINKMWKKFRKLDHYFPSLAYLGEQAVKTYEIYADGSANDDKAFGYQERNAEYRYRPSIVTGEFNSEAPETLDIWHYGDEYTDNAPVLSQDFIEETPLFFDRTLAVSMTNADQFKADFCFRENWHRPMPLWGIPGLIDHM